MEAGSLCRAVYAFAGDGHPSGLRFDAGDTIRVLQTLTDGWCEGEKGDDKGWFPAAYVRLVECRIRIEEEYAKNLSKMSQSPLALQEEGTLGEAWSQLKKSLADEAEVHLKFAAKLHTEVEKPLLSYRENLKKELKKFEHHISEHRKQLLGRLVNVDKAKKVLAERQRDLEVKSQQLEIKPTNKTEEDIKKARRKSTQAGDDLMKCVDLYNQAQSKWFEEVVTTSLELERMESSRIEMVQEHLCVYAQLRHETDMFNQSTMEPVDQSLQKVDPTKDRELWIKEHKTGHVQPVNMEV
uniref:Growth arrest-specific protein 7-like n=1 Tax=Petromyzon marinus TaxID=7757 RepID=A0AAJ7U9E5_PETMA|nr:growth arrest-specific protein 7-like [Petromyzon marinus]